MIMCCIYYFSLSTGGGPLQRKNGFLGMQRAHQQGYRRFHYVTPCCSCNYGISHYSYSNGANGVSFSTFFYYATLILPWKWEVRKGSRMMSFSTMNPSC